METVYKKREGNIELRIYPDYDCESPRAWDNVGAFWADGMHRRYNFHEETASDVLARLMLAFPVTDEIMEATGYEWEGIDYLKHYQAISDQHIEDYAVLPVYMYEHSGLSFSTAGFTCQWDSGTIGWIICDRERWEAVYGSDWDIGRVEERLRDEVETLDNYHVYGNYYFELIEYTDCKYCGNEEEDILESCGGFMGPIPGEGGAKASLKDHLPDNAKHLIEDWY